MSEEITASSNLTSQTNALSHFAVVAERLAATSKRNEKAAFLGEYFTKLSDNDLVIAARYFSGYIFPLRDQRNINIGEAALVGAIATLDVVVTAAEVGSGKRSRFLSDFTFAVRKSETDSTLLNVGKAYSGLTDAEVTELSQWFRAHTLQELEHGKLCVVEPKIVLEITFDRVQPSERHNSGYALRFPRILRIRNDKPAEEIDTLETVKRLAEIVPTSSEDMETGETSLSSPPTFERANSPTFERANSQPPLLATMEAARDAFRAFVERIDIQQRLVILHDSDADGITAGVVLQLALSKAGFGNVIRVIDPYFTARSC